MKGSLADFIGVQEDAEFQFIGCDDLYEVKDNLLWVKYRNGCWEKSCKQLNNIMTSEIVKYHASDAERVILSSLNEKFINGWIIRVTHNDLFVSTNEPQHIDDFGFLVKDGEICRLPFNHLFNFVKPNLEAIKIGDIL